MKKQEKNKVKIQNRGYFQDERSHKRRVRRGREGCGGHAKGLKSITVWSPFILHRVVALGVCYIVILCILHIFSKNSTVSIQYLIKTITNKAIFKHIVIKL